MSIGVWVAIGVVVLTLGSVAITFLVRAVEAYGKWADGPSRVPPLLNPDGSEPDEPEEEVRKQDGVSELAGGAPE
jgi:hypothetical protein